MESSGTLPTRPIAAIRDAPSLIWRYFAAPKPQTLLDSKLDEREFVVRFVTRVNREIGGAYVFSCGKNMGVFKAVGYPEDVGEFYRLEEYEGYCMDGPRPLPYQYAGLVGRCASVLPCWIIPWCTTARSPAMTQTAALSRCTDIIARLLTDTEVITYIIDFLVRRKGLTLEEAAGVIAAPFWSTIEQMPEAQRERLTYLRETFAVPAHHRTILHPAGLHGRHDGVERPPQAAQHGGALKRARRVYFASEECAIRVMEPDVETLWAPRGGEAVVVRLNDGVTV